MSETSPKKSKRSPVYKKTSVFTEVFLFVKFFSLSLFLCITGNNRHTALSRRLDRSDTDSNRVCTLVNRALGLCIVENRHTHIANFGRNVVVVDVNLNLLGGILMLTVIGYAVLVKFYSGGGVVTDNKYPWYRRDRYA